VRPRKGENRVIKVNDTWFIDVDTNGNYSPGKLSKIKTQKDKDGVEKEVRPTEGYCTSLESALKFIRDRMTAEVLAGEDMTLAEAIVEVRAINKSFEDKFYGATH
jgi:hypothetical protein